MCKKKDVLRGPAELEDKNGETLLELTNAATVMECTGLIQVPPESEEELESYENIYRFSPREPMDSQGDDFVEKTKK